jgi:hypothetical protein
MRTLGFLLAVSSVFAGCNWTEFDDITNKAWVDSTTKPDLGSSDWAVVIQRGADASESATSGTLAVIGAGEGTYSELLYSATGSGSVKTNSLKLKDIAINNLDAVPILVASPKTAEVALITTGDPASIVVASGVHTLLVHQIFVGTTTLGSNAGIVSTPDAAAYMQPKQFPGGIANPGPAPIVAVGDVVMGTIYMPPSVFQQPACRLTDGGNPIQVRAIAAVPGPAVPPGQTQTDDFLVWNGADGKLLKYDGTHFNGCVTAVPLLPTPTGTKTPFLPGHGSQILRIDDTHVLLQGHQDISKGNGSFLQVYDTTTLTPVGMMITTEGLRSAAVLSVGATNYVLAGYPQATVDVDNSTITGGAVNVFQLGALQAITSAMPSAILQDAQAENNQLFGRAVAVMPYNGQSVIAVAAGNEVFVYFRANLKDGTPMYDERRTGK